MKPKLTAMVGLLFVISLPALAEAATFTVTTDADSGPGSLRQAIIDANANGVADTIDFDADYTIVLLSTLPDVTTDISINGNGWDRTIVDGGNPPGDTDGVRAFKVRVGGTLVLDGVMVQNCLAVEPGDFYGGAVWSEGVFVFRNSRAEQNRSFYGGFLANVHPGHATIEFSDMQFNLGEYAGGAVHNLFGGVFEASDSVFYDNTGGDAGGAVFNERGEATIQRCAVVSNSSYELGGGICHRGNYSPTAFLDVKDSLFFDNNAAVGGGVYITGDGSNPSRVDSRLTNVEISGNHADLYGGGLYANGRVDLSNGTVSGNTSDDSGGGIYNWGGLWLSNVTIIDNTALIGGGIRTDNDSDLDDVFMKNSIIAGNIGGNCAGQFTTFGYNIEDTDTCDLNPGAGDLPQTDPLVEPLADNGGPTNTHALQSGSPANDGGNPGGCTWNDDGDLGTPEIELTFDQRDYPRPWDGDRNGTPVCDVGAYEFGLIFMDGFESGDTSEWSSSVP